MLAMKVIDPAQTEWASPIVFVSKRDATLRFCAYYRELNAVATRNSYTIPRMDECIGFLGSDRKISSLDADSGYWNIDVHKSDRKKTAVTHHHDLYQYIKTLLVLRNAQATFQRVMDFILFTVKWQYALV